MSRRASRPIRGNRYVPMRWQRLGSDSDGSRRLTGPDAGELIAHVLQRQGGRVVGWRLDSVDRDPGRYTTALYAVDVEWPDNPGDTLIGLTIRSIGLTDADRAGLVFGPRRRPVVGWMHPHDPELPGLAVVASPAEAATRLRDAGVSGCSSDDGFRLDMLGYRPRRRAVLRLRSPAGQTWYLKVLPTPQLTASLARHVLLLRSGIPVPQIQAVLPEGVVVTRALPGRPLSQAVFEEDPPIHAQQLLDLLDSLPAAAATLPRRASWTDLLPYYTRLAQADLPDQARRLASIERRIRIGTREDPPDQRPVHGDFHDGQIFVAGGQITGLLDTDTVGPGRRVDDLACLLAHLRTVRHTSPEQERRLELLRTEWQQAFERTVPARSLRLRAAAVAVSLVTAGRRRPDEDTRAESLAILNVAENLAASAD